MDRKYEEAIPFIEEIWEKEAQENQEIVRMLNKKLDSIEKAKNKTVLHLISNHSDT